MSSRAYRFVSEAMRRAGAPSIETVSSAGLRVNGFFLEENFMSAAEVPPIECSKPSAGMVVSPDPVDWNWRQAGREHGALFHVENICTNPGAQIPRQWWAEPITILTICFEPTFLTQSLQGLQGTKPVELKLSPTGADPVVAHLFWALHYELRAGWPSGPIPAEAMASALAGALCRRFSNLEITRDLHRGGLSGKALATVTAYIHDNIGANLSLKTLSDLVGLSPFHFCRQFKASTSRSVHDYVLSVRMEMAKTLLRSTELSIPEVAHRSGLPNLSHFTTVFRKRIGASPKVFRTESIR